jgi:hypothetical protein
MNDPKLYEGEDKDRMRLYQVWARPKNIFKVQPLDLIRKYFGEKIGLYFAWLGIYITLLVPASLFGIGCFIYGLATLPSSHTANDICDEEGMGATIMCPACDRWCNYTQLHESCIYARITHVFDNRATIAMAIFMSAWALIFIEIWRRQQAGLQYDWDVEEFELEEVPRDDYYVRVKTTKKNPITGRHEPYLTGQSWFVRRGSACMIILFMVAVVLAAIFSIIVYRLAVVAALFAVDHSGVRAGAKIITSITSSIINLIICMVLSQLYNLLAKCLTNFEAHRTQTSYEDSLTFKLVVFQFINFYGFIFYIAYFKGSFVDPPGRRDMYIFNKYREDQCDPSGCIIELTIQLATVMIGKQIINSTQQLVIPWLLGKWRSRDIKNKEIYMRWEQDYDLNPVKELGLFAEYVTMVLQFGFVTLFVSSFPLAPLCALVNNVIELRLDAYKMTKILQRPVAVRAQDIGAWFGVLQTFAYLAVITNAFIIAWTSDLVPKMYYRSTFGVSSIGYVNHTLAIFDTKDFLPGQAPDTDYYNNITFPTCRYRAYRYGPDSPNKYEYTMEFWKIMTARLAFVIVFEHVCIFIMFCVATVIPDESGRVKRLRVYERELNRRMAFDSKFAVGDSTVASSVAAFVNKGYSVDDDNVVRADLTPDGTAF